MTTPIPMTFQFEDTPVRVLEVDGQPAFIANDLCRVLEIRNPRDAIANLDEDEKGVASCRHPWRASAARVRVGGWHVFAGASVEEAGGADV